MMCYPPSGSTPTPRRMIRRASSVRHVEVDGVGERHAGAGQGARQPGAAARGEKGAGRGASRRLDRGCLEARAGRPRGTRSRRRSSAAGGEAAGWIQVSFMTLRRPSAPGGACLCKVMRLMASPTGALDVTHGCGARHATPAPLRGRGRGLGPVAATLYVSRSSGDTRSARGLTPSPEPARALAKNRAGEVPAANCAEDAQGRRTRESIGRRRRTRPAPAEPRGAIEVLCA